MPPETDAVPIPSTMGRDAMEYLEAHGLVAHVPHMRSSDFEVCLANPFAYYIHRRLGLTDPLRWSAALAQGSWFHERLRHFEKSENEAQEIMNQKFFDRLDELRGICAACHILPETHLQMADEEERAFHMALAWYEAMMDYPIPERKSLRQYLLMPFIQVLGHEVLCKIQDPSFPKVELIAQYDILVYHEGQNSVWIIDPKTCAEQTHIRLASCPIEFQTQHYLYILKKLIESGELQEKFNLPHDVKVGGMIHIAVQKPTIHFGNLDRDYEEMEHTYNRGEKKGETVIKRNYSGEPRFVNYVERCRRWYRAESEYEHRAGEMPPVNQSTISGSLIYDPNILDEHFDRCCLIYQYATCSPWPSNFPKSARSIQVYGKLSTLSPLYLMPVKDWPTVIQEMRLVKRWRDEGSEWGDENIMIAAA